MNRERESKEETWELDGQMEVRGQEKFLVAERLAV